MIFHPIDGAIDRRASFRVPAVEQRVGRLRIARREILVELIDESAEGFAILLGGTLDCHVGQTARLQTSSGWAEVRIMNASMTRAVTAAEAGESCEIACTRLGLQRLRDLPVKHRANWLAALAQSLRKPLVPLFSTWSGAALTVFIVAGGSALFVTGLEHPRDVIALFSRDMPRAFSPPAGPEPTKLPDAWTSWPEFPWAISVPSADNAASDAEHLPAELVRFTRPEYLLHPETIEKLALSELQLRKLRAHAQSQSGAGLGSWDHQAARSALAILTAEQRLALERLAGH